MTASIAGRLRGPGLPRLGPPLTALALGVGLPLAMAAPTPARAEPTVLFVLDVSGSMWGRIEGDVSKIEAARDVMGGLLRGLPPEVAAGLVAYGHRRKGDCADIELIQAPTAGAGASLADALPRLVPRGKTPIADALKQAGDQLAQIEDEAAVVLVSDGIETCAGDPCAVAEALHGRDVRLKVHVVGYDISADQEAVAQLQCVAERGGGRYFPADDVAGLSGALTTLTEAVVAQQSVQPPAAPPPPQPPKVEAPAAAATKTKVIKVAGPGTVELAPAPWVALPPYWWKLVNPETGEEIGQTKERSLKVKPGSYQVAWRQDPNAEEVLLPEVIDVRPNQITQARIDTGARLVAPEGIGPPYYWRLVDGAGEAVASYKALDPVPVPAGRYRLIWRQTSLHDQADLGEMDFEAGALTDVLVDQGVNVVLPDWMPGRPYLIRFAGAEGRPVQVGGPGPSVLAPGRYKVGLRLTPNHDEVPWGEVEVPEQGFIEPPLNSGLAFLSTDQAPYGIWAVNLDSQEEVRVTNSWGPLAIPPGRYRIDLRPDPQTDRFTIIEELEIGPDELIQVEM